MTDTPRTGAGRRELHFRRIDMRGWERDDGLYEVEGRVVDRKPHDFTAPSGKKVAPAGQPIHDMSVRLVFDAKMVVREVTAFIDSYPYDDCTGGGQALQALVGLHIGGGWSGEVRKRLGGASSCAHLRELLIPLATAAFQSTTMMRMQLPDQLDAAGKPVKLDSCYTYASDRGLALHRWPAFYTGPGPKPPQPPLTSDVNLKA